MNYRRAWHKGGTYFFTVNCLQRKNNDLLVRHIDLLREVIAKVKKINKIRSQKSQELIASGDSALDPYEFDYLLLCNKICGASHYNMQMKIIVESEKEYEKWIAEQQTFAEVIQ